MDMDMDTDKERVGVVEEEWEEEWEREVILLEVDKDKLDNVADKDDVVDNALFHNRFFGDAVMIQLPKCIKVQSEKQGRISYGRKKITLLI
jgi:hypothetical protein